MLKKYLTSILFLSVFIITPLAHAQLNNVLDPACTNIDANAQNNAQNSSVCKTKDTVDNPLTGSNGILIKAAQLVSLVVGIASVIMIIIGGFKFVLSNGDANNVQSAKNIIMYAVVGVIVSLASQSIIVFVFKRL